ncbi:MAG: FISUMP domain-containing protein [Bacteroidales bacterium]|nr:FISUMP domain-containing protein [Bacteroidales bacterium]
MNQQEFFKRYSYNVRTDKIGGGTFGTVYKAFDEKYNKYVAVKVSEVRLIGNKEFSLKDEFEAIKDIPAHKNIANYEVLYTFEMPNGIFDYAVMQFYEGGNLGAAIKQGITATQKEQVAADLLQGIIHLHTHKLVHRDLKPGNILVVRRGDNIVPVITDFGLSKQVWEEGESRFSNSFGGGTLKYSSPEQLRGEELRFNTDLWSYGVIVHQVFTGKDLFFTQTQSSGSAETEKEIYEQILNKDLSMALSLLPANWAKAIALCLERDPSKRIKSAGELQEIILNTRKITPVKDDDTDNKNEDVNITGRDENTIIDHPILPPQPDPQPQPQLLPQPQPKPSKRKIFWIPGIALLLLVVLFIWRPWSGPGAEESAAIEQARLDSIAAVESEHARLDSIAVAELEHARLDSIAADSIAQASAPRRGRYQATSPATTAIKATVVTGTASNIQQTTATVTGNVTSDGGSSVTERGICYSIGSNPTTSSSKASAGSGTGSFTANLTGLRENTTYYVRAYAINEKGTAYGDERSFATTSGTSTGSVPASSGTFTDTRDGKTYKTVRISTQTWMAENLNYTTSSGSWCYDNNTSNCTKYGRLYDWNTALTACPSGWHLPSDAEWTQLTTYLGGESVAGGKLKEIGSTHWFRPNADATNETGFSALPGGNRYYNGTFLNVGRSGYWWSSTEYSSSDARNRYLHYNGTHAGRDDNYKTIGFSVRCVRDN